MPPPLFRSWALPLLTALAVTACAEDGGGADNPVTLGEDAAVAVDDDVFEPAHAVVSPGTTVTWEWVGSARHNVVGDDFESEVTDSGTFTHTFEEAGTYSYTCTLHPGMDGTVEVVEETGGG